MADLPDDDHDTGFHDHDISAGAVAVVSGAVREERLRMDGPPQDRTFVAGGSFHFSPADITACGMPAPTRPSRFTSTRLRSIAWAHIRSTVTAYSLATRSLQELRPLKAGEVE